MVFVHLGLLRDRLSKRWRGNTPHLVDAIALQCLVWLEAHRATYLPFLLDRPLLLHFSGQEPLLTAIRGQLTIRNSETREITIIVAFDLLLKFKLLLLDFVWWRVFLLRSNLLVLLSSSWTSFATKHYGLSSFGKEVHHRCCLETGELLSLLYHHVFVRHLSLKKGKFPGSRPLAVLFLLNHLKLFLLDIGPLFLWVFANAFVYTLAELATLADEGACFHNIAMRRAAACLVELGFDFYF